MPATIGPASAPPPLWLAAIEWPRAALEFGAMGTMYLRSLRLAPAGDGGPVLVLPGFGTGDIATAPLRATLRAIGYDARGWGLGLNWGPAVVGRDLARLSAVLETVHLQTGKPVDLVGWSLGGIMARNLATKHPQKVRQVVSIGSPIAGDPRHTLLWPAYRVTSGQSLREAREAISIEASERIVPMTAIYSRSDGIVPWQNCREQAHPNTANIETGGSHLGLVFSPTVFNQLAQLLASSPTRHEPPGG